MVMDRNGMSHRPAGLPGAGRYERGPGAADDLDLYEPDGPWGSAEVVAEGIDDGWIDVRNGVDILSDDAPGPTAPRGVEAVVAAVERRDYRDAVDRLAAVRGWVEDECPNSERGCMSAAALSFMVHEPKEIIELASDMSRSSSCLM